MSSNSKLILSQHTHLGDSSVETVVGEKAQGDGFYGRSDGVHTVQYAITAFVGTVMLEATLATDPAEQDWFTVYEEEFPLINNTATTTSKITNFTGNYVWVRASVVYSGGTVNSILLNH